MTDLQRKLVEKHVGLAHSIAIHQCRVLRYGELDVLTSDAFIGLIHAARNYDSTRGTAFSTFATHRIKGAIIDGLRSRDMNRNARADLNKLHTTQEKLEQHLGRVPTYQEQVDSLGWTQKRGNRTIEAWKIHKPIPIEPLVGENGEEIEVVFSDDSPTTLELLMKHEEATDIISAVATLSPREGYVISQYFWGDCTLRQIGKELGISEPRVCQIKRKAMARLRDSQESVSTDLRWGK